MMMRHFIPAFAFVLVVLLPQHARACSVVEDYRVPTNLELVDQSHLILRGRVTGEAEGEDEWSRILVVEPLEALKGSLPSGPIEISGSGLIPEEDDRGFGILSNPYDLEGAHPLSYIGACVRYLFPEGTTALFFLEQEQGKWRAAGGAFSRWGEDVIRSDAPWLILTRFYARVIEADPADRISMLKSERDRLLALEDDPVARLMARDIERQLAGPNETWNSVMRRAIEGDGEIPAGAESEVAADAITDLIGDLEAPQADAMEEAPALCDISTDGQSADCDGVRFVREGNALEAIDDIE